MIYFVSAEGPRKRRRYFPLPPVPTVPLHCRSSLLTLAAPRPTAHCDLPPAAPHRWPRSGAVCRSPHPADRRVPSVTTPRQLPHSVPYCLPPPTACCSWLPSVPFACSSLPLAAPCRSLLLAARCALPLVEPRPSTFPCRLLLTVLPTLAPIGKSPCPDGDPVSRSHWDAASISNLDAALLRS